MIKLLEAIMDIVFIALAVYGIFVLRKWYKVAIETDEMWKRMKEENGWED